MILLQAPMIPHGDLFWMNIFGTTDEFDGCSAGGAWHTNDGEMLHNVAATGMYIFIM